VSIFVCPCPCPLGIRLVDRPTLYSQQIKFNNIMKRTIILIGIAISLSITSFSQVIRGSWPDTISIPQEQFNVKQRLVTGSVCLVGGGMLVYVGREITRGKIETTVHPDNFFFPGYSFIGIGVAAFVSAYLKWEEMKLMVDERGIGFIFRLYLLCHLTSNTLFFTVLAEDMWHIRLLCYGYT
jgi:hypothetical protein